MIKLSVAQVYLFIFLVFSLVLHFLISFQLLVCSMLAKLAIVFFCNQHVFSKISRHQFLQLVFLWSLTFSECLEILFLVCYTGLYGDYGILPARSLLENSKHQTLSAKVHYQPTLLWLAPYLGLDTNYALDVLALLGSFLAFTG